MLSRHLPLVNGHAYLLLVYAVIAITPLPRLCHCFFAAINTATWLRFAAADSHTGHAAFCQFRLASIAVQLSLLLHCLVWPSPLVFFTTVNACRCHVIIITPPNAFLAVSRPLVTPRHDTEQAAVINTTHFHASLIRRPAWFHYAFVSVGLLIRPSYS